MNERMGDLLDRASRDDGAPLGFSGETVMRQGRARLRRRHGATAVGLTAAAVATLVVATQVASPSSRGVRSPADSTGTPSHLSPTPTPTGPALTPQQRAVTELCAHQHTPAPLVHSPSGPNGLPQPTKGATIQDTTTAGPRAAFLRHWTLDAFAADALGTSATFVNPARTRWASCEVAAGGTQDADGVWTAPLPTGPVPRSWHGANGFRHQGNTVSWSQVCTPGEGKVCARELFSGTLVRYAGVAAVRVEAPDGSVLKPVLGRYTYVFRHAEQRVDPHRAANDLQTMPSMPVTLLNAAGHTIIRYDYFPSEILPGKCPPTGGC